MATSRLPTTAGDVTASWLTESLRAGGLDSDASVSSYTSTPIGDAMGLMGEITRFDLSWDLPGQEPSSVILKVPSVIEGNRALGMALGAYEGEHRVYSEIVADLGIRTPRCWFSAGDATTGEYALLIEDLTGHDRIDQMDGVGLPEAETCVDALADLHTRWWDSDDLAALTWLPDGFGETLLTYRDLVAASLPAYEQAHAGLLSPDDVAVCHRFVNEYEKLIDLSLDTPLTLLHRDYRIDNILFEAGSPVVLDWGNVGRGGGLFDLAYFLSGSLTIENRRSWGDDLLARYADRLAQRGIRIDGFEQRHRESALFCLVVPILIGGDAMDTRDEKGERLAAEMTRRLFAYLNDYEATAALD
jgi:thiamine kinase-like enzyme